MDLTLDELIKIKKFNARGGNQRAVRGGVRGTYRHNMKSNDFNGNNKCRGFSRGGILNRIESGTRRSLNFRHYRTGGESIVRSSSRMPRRFNELNPYIKPWQVKIIGILIF